MQVIDGDGRACFRKPIAIGYGDAQVVEKLERLRLGECASYDNGAQFAAETDVDLLE
jgi:hypothetical protein